MKKTTILICFSIFQLCWPSFSKASSPLKSMNCDDLIKRANSESYSLKNLAALYARRNCKDFNFDLSQLSAEEKQIFKVKFDEIDPDSKKTTDSNESLSDLKKSYKAEKNKVSKYAIFKKLRQKYKDAGKKNEGVKLISDFYKEIYADVKLKQKQKSFDPELYSVLNDMTSIYAKNLWNDDKVDQAQKTTQQTIDLIQKKSPVYNLYFLLAKIQEDKLLIDSAVKNYNLSLQNYEADSTKKIPFDLARVEWNKAWMQYLHDTPEKATQTLKDLSDKTTDSAEKSRALFFLAKLYKKTNKAEESKKIHEENIKNDFFSFYSLASYAELGINVPPINQILSDNSFDYDGNLNFLDTKRKKFFTDLVDENEIEMSDRAATVMSKNNSEYTKLGLYLAHTVNYYMPLFTGYARANMSEKKDLFAIHSRLLFPEVHADKVKEMSEKTKVSKPLIYSIMKQESGFNPESRSPANAMGLMQVIPTLAKSLAKKYKIENYKKAEDLYNPNVNIELGTYELKDQVEKQNGQLSFVASAYNAGPGAIKRWREREPISDMFEFIESIPYDETRTYVKIIARNMLFYQRLAQPSQAIPFPSDFIKLTDTTL